MSATPKGLGFIGLGMMGYPMASLLHRAGYPLTVFDVAQTQVTPVSDRALWGGGGQQP